MTTDERGHTSTSGQDDLRATLRTILLGAEHVGARRVHLAGLALGVFGVTFLAYELGVFSHAGGVVFVPFHAAMVGLVAAFWAGYRRTGLLSGWVLAYLSFLGWRAEWATDISPRPFVDRIAYVVRPDGLLVLAVFGILVAIAGFVAGALARRAVDALRTSPRTVGNT